MTSLAAERVIEAASILKRCQEDPVFFSKHVLGGEQPWEMQRRVMQSVRDHARTAVPSGFAVGKTWVAARIALWFLCSFPHSLVITTAPTWRQVENVLWAEIRRQHRTSKMCLGGTVLQTAVRISDDWFALGLSTDEPERFQGFHAAHLLLVFDEASGVSRDVWDAAEGQMASWHARWLAIGNPIAPTGPFYGACCSELWNVIPISCLDSPNVRDGRVIYPKLVTREWVEERKAEWGEESPLYQSRVLGKFPTASEHGLIPLDWVFQAQSREPAPATQPRETFVGADVARSGADATVFLLREGSKVSEVEEHHHLSLMETAGRLIRFVERHDVSWGKVHVDVIGMGAGVVDRLHEQGYEARGINFGSSAKESDKFLNQRAECYWAVRDALRPDGEYPLIIPSRFGKLAADLVAIEWKVSSSGKIQIEDKDQVKKRIGRSPDHADALALSYAKPASRASFEVFDVDDDFGGDEEDDFPVSGRWQRTL